MGSDLQSLRCRLTAIMRFKNERIVRSAIHSFEKHHWWFVSVLYLQLLQIPLLSSLVVIMAISIIIRFGIDGLRHAGFQESGLGAGFIFASGIFVVTGQLLLLIKVPATLAHGGILIAFLIFTIFSRIRCTRADAYDSITPEFLFAVGIALLVFAIRHPWTLPFALSVVLLDWILRNDAKRRILQPLATAAILGGWLISFYLRPESWWYFYYTTTDAGLFESISWIGSEWGVTTRPGMVGESFAGYHWLSYVFFGGLSHVAWLPPWDGLMKFGLPLLLIVFASLFSGSPMLTKESRNSNWTWLVTLLVVATYLVYRVDSALYGLLAGLCLLSLVLSQQRDQIQGFLPTIVLMISTVTLMLSKAPTAAVVGATIVMVSITSVRPRNFTSWLPTVAFVVASSSTYLILFHGETSSNYLQETGGRTLRQLLAETFVVPPSSLVTIALLLLIILHGSQGKTKRIFSRPVSLLGITSIVVVAVSVLHLIFLNGSLVFVPGHFYLLIAACWVVLNWQFRVPHSFETYKLAGVIGVTLATGLAGFAWPVFSNRLNQKFEISAVLGELGWESFTKVIPFVPIWLILLAIASQRILRFTNFQKVLVLAACLGITIGIQLDSARRVATHGHSVYTSSQDNDSAFPTRNLQAVGQYIRLNTDKDLILATNDFCCFGNAWWLSITKNIDEYVNNGKPTRWGGDNHLLVAESRRRILIQGLAFQLGAGTPSPEQIQRMSLSLEFANQPNASTLVNLQRAGVSGFVVNLDLTKHRDWSEFATERFRSGNYLYLELK